MRQKVLVIPVMQLWRICCIFTVPWMYVDVMSCQS